MVTLAAFYHKYQHLPDNKTHMLWNNLFATSPFSGNYGNLGLKIVARPIAALKFKIIYLLLFSLLG
jgi:hypothetical protein